MSPRDNDEFKECNSLSIVITSGVTSGVASGLLSEEIRVKT